MSEHNSGEKSDQPSAEQLEAEQLVQFEEAYTRLEIGAQLGAMDLETLPYAHQFEDTTGKNYTLGVGSDYCVISLLHPTEGRLAAKVPGQLAMASPETQSNVLQWRATAIGRCLGHPSFEQGVAVSAAEQVLVTRQVEGTNLADFTQEDVAALTLGSLQEFVDALQYADTQDVHVDCDAASNFSLSHDRIVCLDYSLKADDIYQQDICASFLKFSRSFDPYSFRETHISPAQVEFGRKILTVAFRRFPEAHDLHIILASDQVLREQSCRNA